ncbi:MAG: hypothetical protein KAR35_01775 [Candidatus Heimdallarchaeota archaeon]|nr:hypothetical protein [Candidatus Heimdallarchaeota archaeon]MCK5048081.1 hypothetical protein [Candidatus Heimdallarchaeota archaeon]
MSMRNIDNMSKSFIDLLGNLITISKETISIQENEQTERMNSIKIRVSDIIDILKLLKSRETEINDKEMGSIAKECSEIAIGSARLFSLSSASFTMPETSKELIKLIKDLDENIEYVEEKLGDFFLIYGGGKADEEVEEEKVQSKLAENITQLFSEKKLENHPLLGTILEMVAVSESAAKLEIPKIIELLEALWTDTADEKVIEKTISSLKSKIKKLEMKTEIEEDVHMKPLNEFLFLADQIEDMELDDLLMGAAYLLPQLLSLSPHNAALRAFVQEASHSTDDLRVMINFLSSMARIGEYNQELYGEDYNELKREIKELYTIRGFFEILNPKDENKRRMMGSAQMAFRQFLADLEQSYGEDIIDFMLESGKIMETEEDRTNYASLIPGSTLRRREMNS